MIAEYLEHQAAKGRSAVTLREYRKRLRWFREATGVVAPRDVTIDHVRKYHQELIRRGLAPGSRKTVLSTIRGYLRWAYERGLMISDIAPRIEIPKPGKRLPPTPLSHEDVVRLIELVPRQGRVHLRNRAILELLYACGLRRGELLALNVGDVDFREGTLFVRGKGDKERILPVHETALDAVALYLEARRGKPRKRDPLFVVHGGSAEGTKRLDENALAQFFRKVARKLGKHIHPHLMRHTFAVHMLQGGADLRYVQALLGHESPDTTSGYLGLVREDLKRAYDAAVGGLL